MTSNLEILSNYITRQGFDASAIGCGFHAGDLEFTSTFRDNWQTHYFENNFLSIDPLPFCALSGSGPLRWSEIRGRMRKNPVMNAASDFGLKEGFALSSGGFVVSVHHSERLSDKDLNHIQSAVRRKVASFKQNRPTLSNSQKGLVDLLGVGLSIHQQAEYLGISAETVKSRKRDLFKKFRVNSDAQLLRVLRNE